MRNTYHLTFKDRSGKIQVDRLQIKHDPCVSAARERQQAIRSLAWKHCIPTRNVQSAVNCGRSN